MNSELIAEKVARYLLEIEAVKLNVNEPFTWASGLKSPIYCDNRRILSFPQVRDYVRESLAAMVKALYPEVEVIAGVATGAIAHGVLAAQELNLPFVYVRSAQKEHGLGNMIEGFLPPAKKVVVIEDLVSTGQSSLIAVEALLEAQSDVQGMIAIFTYGLDRAKQNMESAQCPLHTLTNFDALTKQAINMGVMHHSSIESLEQWKADPAGWRR
jgi:orotate phosphoribosyltransferase